MTDKTALWKNPIPDLDAGFRQLSCSYSIGDTRASYLRTFEITLDQLCRRTGESLWDMKTYKETADKYPIPDDHTSIPSATFYKYIQTYNAIIDDIGMLKDPFVPSSDPIDMTLLKIGGMP